jgi:hypothetical protein
LPIQRFSSRSILVVSCLVHPTSGTRLPAVATLDVFCPIGGEFNGLIVAGFEVHKILYLKWLF